MPDGALTRHRQYARVIVVSLFDFVVLPLKPADGSGGKLSITPFYLLDAGENCCIDCLSRAPICA